MSKADQEILELRRRVEKLERQMMFVLQQQDIEYRDTLNQTAPLEVVELLRQGRKLQAIKVYREATGVGLKQAKDYVESLERHG